MSSDKNKDNRPTGDGAPATFRLGGRDIKVGDSMTPGEAEEFFQHLMSESKGPVTIEHVDESAGTTVRNTVKNWSEFEQGPRLSADHLAAFRDEAVRKGYLAFEYCDDGLRYHTAFRTLTSRYFSDFDRFVRCQDIPGSYFGPAIPGKSWFVSHRWTTAACPDPNRTQFEIVRDFARRHEVTGIWYDYSCMPQEPHTSADRQVFADSLKHMNSLIITTNVLSIESDDYLTRAWCHYERLICELLCTCDHARVAPRGAPDLSDDVVNKFIVEGSVPPLKATKPSDLPLIKDLLDTGADLFRTLAIGTTFTLLNSFGFQFGVGTAARFSRVVDFGKLWTIWQILAGSSEGSGIRLPHLLNADRLRRVLTRRHERFGTHARFFADLKNRMAQALDMRIVEQESSTRLASLLNEVSRSGPVPDAYTKLALIQLVYWLAGCEDPSLKSGGKKTEKQRNPPPPRALFEFEVLVIFALDTATPEIDDDWFDEVFQGLASEQRPRGVLFGSWKTLRVPGMMIETAKERGEGIKLPLPLLDELRIWDGKQINPDSIRIVGIREFPSIAGYALTIHVPGGSTQGSS